VDWNNLTPRQRFVLTFSDWFGIRKKAYADLSRQLRARSETDLAAWSAYPEDVKELAACLHLSGKHALATQRE
jgi:hypothetical protein